MPRTLAFGDIHGCLTHLDALLDAIHPTKDDHLVFLGDYVDRGPDSAGVLNRLLQLHKSARITPLMGNHEQMMLAARHSRDAYTEWLFNGGDATLESYAGARGTLRDVPANHWQFLEKQLHDYLETDSHIFVHASAQNDLPMTDQPDYILRWERFEDVAPHQSGKIIICGHTPQKSARPANRGFAICLDTNACRGGLLTCLDALSGGIWQADAKGRVTRAHITDFDSPASPSGL